MIVAFWFTFQSSGVYQSSGFRWSVEQDQHQPERVSNQLYLFRGAQVVQESVLLFVDNFVKANSNNNLTMRGAQVVQESVGLPGQKHWNCSFWRNEVVFMEELAI